MTLAKLPAPFFGQLEPNVMHFIEPWGKEGGGGGKKGGGLDHDSFQEFYAYARKGLERRWRERRCHDDSGVRT